MAKNTVYFSMEGDFSSLPLPKGDNVIFKADVTSLQQDRLQDLLATYIESLNSGNYQLDTFDDLVTFIGRIKAEPLNPEMKKELLDKIVNNRRRIS